MHLGASAQRASARTPRLGVPSLSKVLFAFPSSDGDMVQAFQLWKHIVARGPIF